MHLHVNTTQTSIYFSTHLGILQALIEVSYAKITYILSGTGDTEISQETYLF